MANLTEQQTWATGIYQLETTDPVEGGAEGKSNQQAKQLANRTAWLKQQVDNLVVLPVGTIIIWPGDTPPTGCLECDGSVLSRTTYAALYAEIGTKYGKGAGALANTTFRLPDGRGEFIRGWDHGRGIDPDRASRTDRGDGATGDNVGTKQAHQFYRHQHLSGIGTNLGSRYHDYVNTSNLLIPSSVKRRISVNYTGGTGGQAISSREGGSETRPRNMAMMYVIKY